MANDTAIKADQIIADLRRELAQARAERDAALARETATAEVLGVINSSPGDLAPVFDAMLEKAMRLCGAAFGVFAVYDGEDYRVAATRGVPARLAEFVSQPVRIHPESMPDRLRRGENTIHIPDITALDPELRTPGLAAMIELGNARTAVWVALCNEGAAQGFFGVYRQEVSPFSEKQIALLQNFAAQAVIAMENARLLTETREALEQQTATAEVLGVINASPGDLQPVFEAIVEKAVRLCEFDFSILWTFDGADFRAPALHGVPLRYMEYVSGRAISPTPGGRGALSQIADGADFVQVEDIAAVERSTAPGRALIELGGARTSMAVALRTDRKLLGAIIAFRQEVRPFSEKQKALLQNFAAQAVIAMENARLITETREALEQQTATAEVLGVINSSPGDLAPVFDAILEKAIRVCAADQGAMYRRDGEVYRPVAHVGMSPEYVAAVAKRPPTEAGRHSCVGLAALEKRVVHIADVTADPEYASRETITLGMARTGIGVPLLRDGEPIGVLGLARRRVEPFTEKQIALLENFAAQAVIAMENARLINETREALEQQTATAEVLGVINSSPGDLAPVFDAMLEKAMRLCEASGGALRSYDGEAFHAAAMRGLPAEFVEATQIVVPDPELALGRIARGANIIQVPDLTDPTLSQANAQRRRELLQLGGIHTALWVALRKDDALLGVFVLYRDRVQPFTGKQISLVENFAAQAVIAIENARLITETREALEQQTATAEVLQVINASPGDLTPVFDAMLEKATQLCGADLGHFMRYDGRHFHVLALRGASPDYAEFMSRPIDPARTGGSLAALVRGEPIAHVPDLQDSDAYRSGNPARRAQVDLGGARTGIWAALRNEAGLCGAMCLYRSEVRPFTEKQIALLQNFAAQAVIAMENARLLGELRQRTDEVAEINRELEARVAAQVAELERTGKLRRFLAPQLADLIVAQGDESILETHRREIVVVFCDLRGFTAFAERAEPEEVISLLREYHGALGPIVARFEGTLDHYSGDGIMVFFNDPMPCPEPAKNAVEMAAAMREAAQGLLRSWRRLGHDLGFGVGIAQGYATLGQIGFAERMDYTAIGTVCNLAARLCAEAKNGQILVSSRVAGAVEDSASLEELGDLSLKGLSQAVLVYNVR